MSVSPSFHRPQSLRLSISPPPAPRDYVTATSSSSAARREPWGYESPSGECYERICSVVCLYDFASPDSDHLSFRRNEVLNIVRKEESGWWAAVRGDGSEVGWVPASYVHALSDDAAERPYTVLEKTRAPDLGADQESVTSTSLCSTQSGDTLSSLGATLDDDEPPDTTQSAASDYLSPPSSNLSDPPSVSYKSYNLPVTEDDFQVSLPNSPLRETEIALPSASQHPLQLDKSLPASPFTPSTPISSYIESKFSVLCRSSSGGAIDLQDRTRRRRPVLLDDHSSLLRLSTIMRGRTSDQLSDPVNSPKTSPPPSPSAAPSLPYAHPRPGKILQLTGDDSAQAFHNAKQAQANLPWYLKHQHSEEEIQLEFDGTVKAGTLPALVERLVVDPLRVSQQDMFRRAFLVTFRTFATSTEVFDLLVTQYELEAPPNLTEEEFEHWRREKLRPTQKRVLTVLTMWLEEYDLLNQDPEVAPKLQEFLSLIINPAPLALTARLMLKSLERLTFAEPVALEAEAVVLPSKKWKKARKGDNLELVRVDPMDLAQHLSLVESMLYRKICAQECFLWTKTKEGDTVKNIQAFCATYDRLADWVKCSILEVDALGKRANVLDFWIRVAEKCRSLNNFSSMSSIVAALSSVLISRLHFTWLNSSKESSLEPLRKVIHPASNYAYYRVVLGAIEGPCVPFVGPFLKNIVYAQEQHADNVVVQSGTNPDQHFTLIHFVKRQKWYEIALQMLRFQAKSYQLPEIFEMTNFITDQMARADAKGERWYWQRSDELQRTELLHADIKRGLESAGF